jgi:FkbM family methyltransferase
VRTIIKEMLQHIFAILGYRIVTVQRIRGVAEAIHVEELNLRRNLSLKRGIAAQIAVDATEIPSQSLLVSLAGEMNSQLGQDLFALQANGMKRGGFFVEFGAGDGVRLSNTLLLEKRFGWTGILAEPLPEFHDSIQKNRMATLDTGCVWSQTGEILEFVEHDYLSTLAAYRTSDFFASERAGKPMRNVETVSLIDLLRRNGAPTVVDFLSIDTEGSEFEILKAFPFNDEFSISAIACEHNFTPNREPLAALLASHGYVRVASEMSAHDDWFVLDTPEMRSFWASLQKNSA